MTDLEIIRMQMLEILIKANEPGVNADRIVADAKVLEAYIRTPTSPASGSVTYVDPHGARGAFEVQNRVDEGQSWDDFRKAWVPS